MKFYFYEFSLHLEISYFNRKVALHVAIENNNNEIAKLLLERPAIDVNISMISLHCFTYNLK